MSNGGNGSATVSGGLYFIYSNCLQLADNSLNELLYTIQPQHGPSDLQILFPVNSCGHLALRIGLKCTISPLNLGCFAMFILEWRTQHKLHFIIHFPKPGKRCKNLSSTQKQEPDPLHRHPTDFVRSTCILCLSVHTQLKMYHWNRLWNSLFLLGTWVENAWHKKSDRSLVCNLSIFVSEAG